MSYGGQGGGDTPPGGGQNELLTRPAPSAMFCPLFLKGKRLSYMKTTMVKDADVVRSWYILDATDKPVGRMAVKIAHILRGKNKPSYTPHTDMGDFVVVVNAAKAKLTGSKEEQKMYKSFSGYPDGLKLVPAARVRAKNPGYLITHAVRDMLPKNRLSRELFKRLKVYAGAEHPHTAQKPQAIAL